MKTRKDDLMKKYIYRAVKCKAQFQVTLHAKMAKLDFQ